MCNPRQIPKRQSADLQSNARSESANRFANANQINEFNTLEQYFATLAKCQSSKQGKDSRVLENNLTDRKDSIYRVAQPIDQGGSMDAKIDELLKTPGNEKTRTIRMSPELKSLVKRGGELRGVSFDRFVRLAVINALIEDGLVG